MPSPQPAVGSPSMRLHHLERAKALLLVPPSVSTKHGSPLKASLQQDRLGKRPGGGTSSGWLHSCAFSRTCSGGVRLSNFRGIRSLLLRSTDGGLHGHSNRGRP